MTNQTNESKQSTTSTQQLQNAFTIWQTCLQLWDNEANRFWTRSNIFLIINGVLITFLSSKTLSNTFLMMSSVSGIILCLIWLKVNSKGTWYIKRWRPIIIDIEEQIDIEVFQKLRNQEDPSRLKASTTYMRYGIILFITYFSFLLIQAGYSLKKDYFSNKEIMSIPLKVENARLTDESKDMIFASLESYDYKKIKIEIGISVEQQEKYSTISESLTDQLQKIGFNERSLKYTYFRNDSSQGKTLNKYEIVWLSFSH